jgi:hypothetical protein
MLTKTKIALAATLFAATSSVAMAQGFDPNMANRYPSYAAPITSAPQATAPRGTLRTAPVRLHEGRDVGLSIGQSGNLGPTEIDLDRTDRASSPYAGGGY